MAPCNIVICWILFTSTLNANPVLGEAKFLSHVPYDADELQPFQSEEYSNEDIHDSIVKLPGRIYPKLPYSLDEDHNRQYTRVGRTRSDASKSDTGLGPRTSLLRTNRNQRNFGDHRKSWERHPYGQNDEEEMDEFQPPSTAAPEPTGGPRFDRTMSRNVTAVVGESVNLTCKVLSIGDLTVSWLKGINVISIGAFRYSTDRRISVRQNDGKDEWNLRIKDVKEDDAGPYECQISSFPVLSFMVDLIITEEAAVSMTPATADIDHPTYEYQPTAQLIVSPSPYLKHGDILNFTCLVTHSPGQVVRVVWYFEDQILHPSVPASEKSFHFTRNGRPVSEQMSPVSYDLNGPFEDIRHRYPVPQPNPSHSLGPRNVYRQPDRRRNFNSHAINPRISEITGVTTRDYFGSYPSGEVPSNSESRRITAFQFIVGIATKQRAGKYACRPLGGREASTIVHVQLEEDAAVYSSGLMHTPLQSASIYYLTFLNLVFLFR